MILEMTEASIGDKPLIQRTNLLSFLLTSFVLLCVISAGSIRAFVVKKETPCS